MHTFNTLFNKTPIFKRFETVIDGLWLLNSIYKFKKFTYRTFILLSIASLSLSGNTTPLTHGVISPSETSNQDELLK